MKRSRFYSQTRQDDKCSGGKKKGTRKNNVTINLAVGSRRQFKGYKIRNLVQEGKYNCQEL